MSQENVEIVQQAYRAINDGDVEAGLKLAASDIEIEVSGLFLDQGTFRGPEGLRAYTENLRKVWGDSLRSHPEEFIEHEDRVVVMTRTSATGQTSGATIDALLAHVWTIRGGKIVRFETFASRDEALEAAGLRE
jgi:uncharacterized protein